MILSGPAPGKWSRSSKMDLLPAGSSASALTGKECALYGGRIPSVLSWSRPIRNLSTDCRFHWRKRIAGTFYTHTKTRCPRSRPVFLHWTIFERLENIWSKQLKKYSDNKKQPSIPDGCFLLSFWKHSIAFRGSHVLRPKKLYLLAGSHLQRTGETIASSFFSSLNALSISFRSSPDSFYTSPAETGFPASRMTSNTFSFTSMTEPPLQLLFAAPPRPFAKYDDYARSL